MKFCKFSLFFALFVGVCLPALGQNAMRVNIPFNFIAGGHSLPAGHYRVLRLQVSMDAWYISNDHTGAIVLTNPAESSRKVHSPGLIFQQAGGTYSMMQIWNSRSDRDVPQVNVKQTLVSQVDSKDVKYVELGTE
jgi:hypothetical protein